MTTTRFRISQAAQHRVPGGMIGFYGLDEESDQITAMFGCASESGRSKVQIAVGESATVPGLGVLEVLDVRVSETSGLSEVMLQFTSAHSQSPS